MYLIVFETIRWWAHWAYSLMQRMRKWRSMAATMTMTMKIM